MKTVYTKEELAETLKKGETALVKGSLASEIREKFEKRKKVKAQQLQVVLLLLQVLLPPHLQEEHLLWGRL